MFVSEQLLYTRADLERHKRTGDTSGPLAESGFRGHAHCRFCRRFFFGDNELFAHMQTGHEQCFLCRRARPDKYVYYRDYAELEGARSADPTLTLVLALQQPEASPHVRALPGVSWHLVTCVHGAVSSTEGAVPPVHPGWAVPRADHYRHEHWMCGAPDCKGVVFAAEHELRTHAAREHGDAMSRAERRQAMTIPITLQARRARPAPPPAAAPARQARRQPPVHLSSQHNS